MKTILIDKLEELEETIDSIDTDERVQIRCNFVDRDYLGSKKVYDTVNNHWFKYKYDKNGYELRIWSSDGYFRNILYEDGFPIYERMDSTVILRDRRAGRVYQYEYDFKYNQWLLEGSKIKKHKVRDNCERVLNKIKASYHQKDMELLNHFLLESYRKV